MLLRNNRKQMRQVYQHHLQIVNLVEDVRQPHQPNVLVFDNNQSMHRPMPNKKTMPMSMKISMLSRKIKNQHRNLQVEKEKVQHQSQHQLHRKKGTNVERSLLMNLNLFQSTDYTTNGTNCQYSS